MNTHTLRLLTASFTALAALSLAPLSAQTAWTSTTDSQWTTATNWSPNAVPTINTDVVINVTPAGDLIGGPGNTNLPANSITFGTNPTLGALTITTAGGDVLIVNGAITNNSTFLQTFALPVDTNDGLSGFGTTPTGTTTYAGGSAGITFGALTVNTANILTTGTVDVTGQLNITINTNSNSSSPRGFGQIGTINAPGITIVVSSNTGYTPTSGDFFQLVANGSNLSGVTANTSQVSLTGYVWVTSLIQKGILIVQPSAGGNFINTGVVLPIGADAEFNTGGITLNGGELLTSNYGSTDTGGGPNGTPFSTNRTITINTVGGTIAAAPGTTATYGAASVISNGTTPAGTLTIGDAGDTGNTGTVVLTAPSTYTGPTNVVHGTLKVVNTTGSATGTGAVSLSSGTSLVGGPGSGIAGQVNLNGTNNISSTSGTLTVGSLNITGAGNTLTTGTIAGNATQNATSSFTVNGALNGTDNLLAGANTLTGDGSVTGAVTMNGNGNVVSGTGGGLATGGITVNNSNNTIGTGTVTGAITQNASSTLTVSGAAGSDALASGATLTGSGSGSVGAVTLAGSNTVTGPLTTTGITVNGTTNSTIAGTVSGAITQSSNSILTVSGAAGSDQLASGATLTGSGTGSVGAVTLAGGNTVTGPLTTTGITVNGTTNSTIAGTVSGAITQSNNSILTVSGAAGSDALGTGATLHGSGSGSVGLVTLAGTDTLSGPLTTSGITVSGNGNTISTGTVTGAITFSGTAALSVLGTASGTVNVGNNETLSGTGTTGALTATAGSIINLAGGNGTSLTVGGLSLGSVGSYTSSFTTLDYTTGAGGLETLNGSGHSLTSNNVYVDISGSLTNGTYTLATFNSTAISNFSLSNASMTNTELVGRQTYTLNDSTTGAALTLTVAGVPIPNVAYWNGAVSTVWNDTSNATLVNWSTNLAGTTDAGNTPGANTDVILNSNLQTGTVTTTLGANTTINSLNVNGNGTNTIASGNTLTINALGDTNHSSDNLYTGNTAGQGILIASGANAFTINANVLLGTGVSGNQTWTNNSANGQFTVTGNVAGTATSGTQTLTLTNTAAFGTTISGVISDGSGGGNVAINIDSSNSAGSVLLNNNGNTYTGGTTVTSGVLQLTQSSLANTSDIGSTTSTLTVNGGTFDLHGFNQTVGNLNGTGGTILNNNSGTSVLTVGNGNATGGSYSGTLADRTVGTGTLALLKTGTGTQVLSGTNTYSAGTTINGGILSVASDSNLGTGNLTLGGGELLTTGSGSTFSTTKTIALNTGTDTLAAATNTTATYGGVISDGSGSNLAIGDGTNTGTVVLTATNTYDGTTTVNDGTLQIGNGTTNGSIDASSAATVQSGANLKFDETGTVTEIIPITDNGTVTGIQASGTTTLSGLINGTGGFAQTGAGTTILSHADTYAGPTVVNNGGTLQIGSNGSGSIGNAVTNTVTVGSGSTLAFQEANNSNQSNAISDSGTVEGVEGSGITNILSGNITGSGGFTQNGAGTGGTILTGTDGYLGATTVTSGALQIGNGTSGSISNSSTVTDNGLLVFDEPTGSTQINGISGTGTVEGGEGAGIINTLSGDISASGGFTQFGLGTTVLTNTNTYGGATLVSAGTLQIGNGTTSGSINASSGVTVQSGAVLEFDEATSSTQTNAIADAGTVVAAEGNGITTTLSGPITDNVTSGAFLQSGAGTTILSGTNGYSGGTTISNGMLEISGSGTLGSTSGALAISGGALNLGTTSQTVGAVTVTGASTISNGTLTGSSYAVSAPSGLVTVSANLAGSGTLTKTGASTLLLSGTNSGYSGTVSNSAAGTLVIGSSTALGSGAVTNSGTLETNGIQHVINVGAGGFTQNAGGVLVLNLYGNTAPNNASNEVLNVAGSATLNGQLTINFSNYVPKAGDLYTVVTTTGGITPAGGFTTLDIESNGGQAGYVVTGSLTNSNDDYTLDVIRVNLQLTSIPGISLTPNQMNLAFYLANPNLANLDPSLFNAFTNLGANPQSVEAALDQLTIEKFGNFAISNTFNNAAFSTQIIDDYLASLRSPEGDFLVGNGQLDSSGLVVMNPSMDPGLAQIGSRLLAWNPAPIGHGMLSDTSDSVLSGVDAKEVKSTAAPNEGNNFSTFVIGNIVLGQDFSQPDLPHADTTTGAVQLGADYRVTPHLRVGALFGYGHTDATLDTVGSKASVDSYSPGVYASYAQNGWYANALGSYGFDNFSEDRNISFGGLTGIAHGAPNGDQIVGNLDGGYDFHVNKWTFGPLAGVQYTHLDIDSFTETNFAPADLQVNKTEADSLRSRLGGHASYAFQAGTVVLTPHIDASWQHEFLDQSRGFTSQFSSVGAGSFITSTPNPSRDSALLDCGLTADLNGQISIFSDYMVQAGQSNYFGQSVQAGVKIGF